MASPWPLEQNYDQELQLGDFRAPTEDHTASTDLPDLNSDPEGYLRLLDRRRRLHGAHSDDSTPDENATGGAVRRKAAERKKYEDFLYKHDGQWHGHRMLGEGGFGRAGLFQKVGKDGEVVEVCTDV